VIRLADFVVVGYFLIVDPNVSLDRCTGPLGAVDAEGLSILTA